MNYRGLPLCRCIVLLAAVSAGTVWSSIVHPAPALWTTNGPYAVHTDSVRHAVRSTAFTWLFTPDGAPAPPPLIIFCHGISAEHPHNYQGLIAFLVSHGYAVIYSPFESITAFHSPPQVYDQLWEGTRAGVTHWRSRFDTTRIGIVGHSYGAGAIPWVAWMAHAQQGWGSAGLFLYLMAPWYSYRIVGGVLSSFPPHTRMIVQTFNDDAVNDPRMARDLFENIPLPPQHKTFTIVYGDHSGTDTLHADHNLPAGPAHKENSRLVHWGIWRQLGALANNAFNATPSDATITPGCDSSATFMGTWPDKRPLRPLYCGHRPPMAHPQAWYSNFWNHTFNPRVNIPSPRRHEEWSRVDTETTIRNYLRMPRFRSVLAAQTPPDTSRDTTHATPDLCRATFPDTGYGSRGSGEVRERFFPHSGRGDANTHVVIPVDCPPPWPVIFVAPALWRPSTAYYRALVDHLASRGNLVVFATYNYSRFLDQKTRYGVLYEGFNEGVELYIDKVDSSRIAFIGHSYGAGAVVAVARHFLDKRRWGGNGSALFASAPYYLYNITREELRDWPAPTKMIVQVYSADRWMDHRIAHDLFHAIGIPSADKSLQTVTGIEHGACRTNADHATLLSPGSTPIPTALQRCAVFSRLDALLDYAFTANPAAQRFAMHPHDTTMPPCGTWDDDTPLGSFVVCGDRPAHTTPSFLYLFGWNNPLNERRFIAHPR